MKEVANEDEIATELSRESSIIYATSTPTIQIRNESDKQILEWAAKLELESIELREKSLTLIGKLNDRYVEFKKVIQNFDTVEKNDTFILTRLAAAPLIPLELDSKIDTMLQSCQEEITKKTTKIVEDLYEKTSDKRNEVNLVKTLSGQMEDIQLLLMNISKDMNKMQKKQISLEKQIQKQNENKIEAKRFVTAMGLLNGTTLSNETVQRSKSRNSGPLTRAKSRLLDRNNNKIQKPQQQQQLSRVTGRTIIPWEELAMSTSETSPPDAEYAKTMVTYPSEL
ncbi:hypothetical protein C6P45_002548 [Maudiozyma exigua]|uniref:Uncharacterized protein n=1 Tax=Maudiozyma exigua TaxID=34358 RepID=A0A9P6VY20_MAUEX|nr:hypothetical protein C6P45_002548 [Kazachstania exigua]